MRISLFITCYNDLLFPETGIAVVNLFERLGHTVTFRPEQTCCGQMHYNTGYVREAVPLVRKFVRDFGADEIICSPSASCVAMIRDHYSKAARAAGDTQLEADVNAVVPRVFELSELLVNKLAVEDVGAYFPHRVTYHPSCHSLRMLRVGDAPLRLLRKVDAIDLVELPNGEECCGFGGTFALKNADASGAMLADKTQSVLETNAEFCTAGDNSCLMHIYGALHRKKAAVRTLHLAQILASTRDTPAITDAPASGVSR
jgi:L-lactate dehydrogenase complex protein LldE